MIQYRIIIYILDKIFILLFSKIIKISKGNFDNNFFYNYIYYSSLISKIALINYKIFFKKNPYIGRYLFSNQWGNNQKKNSFQKIIKEFVLNKNKISYLEIGSYAGGSLLCACNLLKSCKINYIAYAIDLHDKIYNKIDIEKFSLYSEVEEYSKSKKVKKLFEHNLKYSNLNIKYFNTDIDGFLKKINLKKIEKIDIFYIDAGHMYNDVLNDIQKCLKIASIQKTKEFLIFGDDHGLPYEKVKKEYNINYLKTDTIRSKITGTTFHPGVTKAVYDCFGTVKSENGIWYKQFNISSD